MTGPGHEFIGTDEDSNDPSKIHRAMNRLGRQMKKTKVVISEDMARLAGAVTRIGNVSTDSDELVGGRGLT